MNIKLTKRFRKQYGRTNLKVQRAFDQRLELFLMSPFNPILNNYSLTNQFKGYSSIDVTGDWRAIYRKEVDLIIFELLGTHSQLYR